jgi:hypothetical protein
VKTHKQPSSTILIGSIPVNKRNEIRVDMGPFAGRMAIHIRRWFATEAGEWKSTKKGILVWIEDLPELDTLVSKAHKQAKRDGLLPKIKGEQADE